MRVFYGYSYGSRSCICKIFVVGIEEKFIRRCNGCQFFLYYFEDFYLKCQLCYQLNFYRKRKKIILIIG